MIPKIIFLDFDGVIIDSNGIKDEAFASIFSEYPDHRDEMMDYHLKFNAVPRGIKFRFVGEKILKLMGSSLERFVQEKTKQFENLTSRSLVECPECAGAGEFLAKYSTLSSLVLISATPVADLKRILAARKLSSFFSEIYGAPIVKSEVMTSVLVERDIPVNSSVFIGDSPEDYSAAVKAAVPFIGIVGRTKFEGERIPIYPNLSEVSFESLEHPKA